ncbi:M48 family metalloprotease [Roseibium sp. M-1]
MLKIVARIAAIEIVRTASLVASAAAAFCIVMLSFNILALPYSLFYGDIPLEAWQVFTLIFGLALLPAFIVVQMPSVAAAKFDIDFATRRPSQREMDLIDKVETMLQESSSATGIKLPRVVWRVRDSGEINAIAYGHDRVGFTKGLLIKYQDEQFGIERLACIAAHEIGHLRNWDTRILMLHHYLNLPINLGIGLANSTINRIPFVGMLFTAITAVLRLPADAAHVLNSSISRLTEYEADRFATRLTKGIGISEILDDFAKMEDQKADTFSAWLIRSHPPAELRQEAVSKQASK